MATPQDLVNADLNLATLDEVVTSAAESVNDRLGQARLTITGFENRVEGAILAAGFYPAAGSFELGGTINERNQVLQRTTSPAAYFSWGGVLPKIVPPSSTVAGTGGESVATWTNRNDSTLRTALSSYEGASIVELGLINFAAYNPTTNPSTVYSLLMQAAEDAVTQGKWGVYVPQKELYLNLYPPMGDISVIADDCKIIGGGYPKAKEVKGFRKDGLIDGQYSLRPKKSQKSGKKAMYVQSAGTVWFVSPKANKTGGIALRMQQAGAPTLSGSGDVGTPWQRWRQTLVYDLTMAWLCKNTVAAESGTWTNSAMVVSGWKAYDNATNLFQTQNMRRNTVGGGEYVEYSVTTDENGLFNVGLYQFNSAANSVEIKDQTNGVVIATLDLRRGSSSTADGYRIYEFAAPKMGTFTLRITNNGTTTTDLRVIGVNIQQLFQSEKFNNFETYDFFNFARKASVYLDSGSAATPVFSVRQGGPEGTAKTGGSIHGGETLNAISWRKDGVEISSSLPANGSMYMGDTFGVHQQTTINWPDGQSANYYEDLEFIGAGAVDATFSMASSAGLQIQNIYNGMCPMSDAFREITAPQFIEMAAPDPTDDVTYYPAVDGENSISFRDPVSGRTVTYDYTVYPTTQVRGYPGSVAVIMRSVGNDDCKFYAPQYLGADKFIDGASGRAITTFG